MTTVTRKQAAEKIKLALESYDREEYSVSVWEGGGRVRCYVKDLGYSNKQTQDRGYVAIDSDGTINYDSSKDGAKVSKIIVKTLANILIESDELAKREIQETRRARAEVMSMLADMPDRDRSQYTQKEDHYFGSADEESW